MGRWALGSVASLVASLAATVGYFWPFGGPEAVLRLPGTVETQEVRLGSKVGGRVAEVTVAEGDIVREGQPLVSFEDPELLARRDGLLARLRADEAELERAQNGPLPQEKAAARGATAAARARLQRLVAGPRAEEIEQARGQRDGAAADLNLATADLRRKARLFQRDALSAAEYDVARASYERSKGLAEAASAGWKLLEAGSRAEDVAEAKAGLAQARAREDLLAEGTRPEEIAAARARVDGLRAALREAEATLREAVVRAPGPVVVEVVAVRKGDLVAPNQPVVRALRAEDLWVRAYAPETELGRLRLHQEVAVAIDAYPGRPFRGEVVQIASISEFTPRNVQSPDERRHQVFALKVRVADPGGIFKSGMAAEVVLPLDVPEARSMGRATR